MVRYPNTRQKALITMMLVNNEHPNDVAETAGVSVRSAWKYKRTLSDTGKAFLPSRASQNARKLPMWALEEVMNLLVLKPDLYLDEICAFLANEHDVHVSTETVRRHLRQEKWKKKRLHMKASQQSPILVAEWMSKISLFTAEMFVFCDESGTDRRDGARRTGWAPRGAIATVSSKFVRGTRYHLLPAIAIDGLLDVLVFRGATDSAGVWDWMVKCLLPKMNPFPGRNSILVMDNASWHPRTELQHACNQKGVLLWYLPPYSPEFNPIEAYFSDFKRQFKRVYRDEGGDKMSDDDFAAFLKRLAWDVGHRVQQIRGHFKNAKLVMDRLDDINKEYGELYADELVEYRETGTVSGRR